MAGNNLENYYSFAVMQFPPYYNPAIISGPDLQAKGYNFISFRYEFDTTTGNTLPSSFTINLEYSDDGTTWTNALTSTSISIYSGANNYYGSHAWYRLTLSVSGGTINYTTVNFMFARV